MAKAPFKLTSGGAFNGTGNESDMRREAARQALEAQAADEAKAGGVGSILGGIIAGIATQGNPAAIQAGMQTGKSLGTGLAKAGDSQSRDEIAPDLLDAATGIAGLAGGDEEPAKTAADVEDEASEMEGETSEAGVGTDEKRNAFDEAKLDAKHRAFLEALRGGMSLA